MLIVKVPMKHSPYFLFLVIQDADAPGCVLLRDLGL